MHCRPGPSDAARAKAILKRQRKAGKVLAGRAAKLKQLCAPDSMHEMG